MVGALCLFLMSLLAPEQANILITSDRVLLQVDASAAEAVLDILDQMAADEAVHDSSWTRLFSTEPYQRLKARESQMQRDFSDADFRAFVTSDELRARGAVLRRTLEAWKARDLEAAAARVLEYLPDDARIHAVVYPMIKPQTNSFVFDLSGNPAIFLYLDPEQSPAQFENTVAHELHHIGFASLDHGLRGAVPNPSVEAQQVQRWLGAFGEGFAMLAAAGGPDVHPHAASPPDVRSRWDRDVARFDLDLQSLDSFFVDVLTGMLDEDEIRQRAFSFYGVQGPWYTVGYHMAILLEQHRGRGALIEAMVDPRLLLRAYNEIARALEAADGRERAKWSDYVLEALFLNTLGGDM